LEGSLSGNDRQAIAAAAGDLLASGESGAMRPWNGDAGNSGQIRLGTTYLLGLDTASGAPVAAPNGIDASVALSPASGNFVTIKNANVRLGASTSAMVSETLNQGTTVRAYGEDKVGNWYLIGVSDSVLGYVSGLLLAPAGNSEPVLAGGSPKRPRVCRDVDITMTTADSHSDSWSAFACKTDSGWGAANERGLS
jgi:hypothetical protein